MSHTRHCPACGKEWDDVPDHVLELFHRCTGERTETARVIPMGVRTPEERKADFFYALLDAVGEDAIGRR